MTYNILKGGRKHEAEILEVIRFVDPDMIVVQEVLEETVSGRSPQH